jgi:hypothetical protein
MATKKPSEPAKGFVVRTRSGPSSGGPKSKFAQRLFEAHLHQLKRVVEKRGVKGLETLYKEARSDIYDRLLRSGKASQKATPVQLRAMLGQVDAVLSKMGSDVETHLKDVGMLAAELGGEHAVKEYKLLEEHFRGTTPVLDLDKASVFRNMVEGVDSSLLRRYRLQSQSWSLNAISAMENRLSIGALSGKPLEDMIRDAMDAGGVLDEQRWKAERIVRTEMAHAHGATKHEAMKRTSEELGDDSLQKRLIETFDDRTGDDSFLIHGQTVPINKPFSYKRKKAGAWVKIEFMHPPNRPNDRAVVIPWDPAWEETEEDRPLTKGELRAAEPTRWRAKVGVEIPPGHRPGRPYK